MSTGKKGIPAPAWPSDRLLRAAPTWPAVGTLAPQNYDTAASLGSSTRQSASADMDPPPLSGPAPLDPRSQPFIPYPYPYPAGGHQQPQQPSFPSPGPSGLAPFMNSAHPSSLGFNPLQMLLTSAPSGSAGAVEGAGAGSVPERQQDAQASAGAASTWSATISNSLLLTLLSRVEQLSYTVAMQQQTLQQMKMVQDVSTRSMVAAVDQLSHQLDIVLTTQVEHEGHLTDGGDALQAAVAGTEGGGRRSEVVSAADEREMQECEEQMLADWAAAHMSGTEDGNLVLDVGLTEEEKQAEDTEREMDEWEEEPVRVYNIVALQQQADEADKLLPYGSLYSPEDLMHHLYESCFQDPEYDAELVDRGGNDAGMEDSSLGRHHNATGDSNGRPWPFIQLHTVCLYCSSDCTGSSGRCSTCNVAVYCNRACQRQGWAAGHKATCQALASIAPELSAVLGRRGLQERCGFAFERFWPRLVSTLHEIADSLPSKLAREWSEWMRMSYGIHLPASSAVHLPASVSGGDVATAMSAAVADAANYLRIPRSRMQVADLRRHASACVAALDLGVQHAWMRALLNVYGYCEQQSPALMHVSLPTATSSSSSKGCKRNPMSMGSVFQHRHGERRLLRAASSAMLWTPLGEPGCCV